MEFGGLPNQCFYCRQLGHFVQGCPKRKEVSKQDNMMQVNQSIMENRGKWIEMNNVEAQWILVKGNLKMKQAVKSGGEMKGNSVIRTDNRYKEFQEQMWEHEVEKMHEIRDNANMDANVIEVNKEPSTSMSKEVPCGSFKLICSNNLPRKEMTQRMQNEEADVMIGKEKDCNTQSYNNIDKFTHVTSFTAPEVASFNSTKHAQRKKNLSRVELRKEKI